MKYKLKSKLPKIQHDGTIIFHRMIDDNNDLNLESIAVNDYNYLKTNYDTNNSLLPFDTFRDATYFLLKNYGFGVNKIILHIDYAEANSAANSFDILIQHNNRYSFILDVCIELKIFNKLVFRSNGITPLHRSTIKYEPIIYYLGKNIENMFDIEKRNFDFHFLSLYGRYTPIRESFFNFLNENKLLSKSIYSYRGLHDDRDGVIDKKWLDTDSTNLKDKIPMVMIPSEYHKNTFCSIVYETVVGNGPTFFTEKINKCFLAGHPFIVISTPNYLKKLKELGFKTFDKWWDESYDHEMNLNKKIKKVKELILQISEWDIETCNRIYIEMIPTLKNNQEIIKNINSKYTSNSYYLPYVYNKNIF